MTGEFVQFRQNFDIYYSGYIQTHCQKNKKIKRADEILPEVYGTTLRGHLWDNVKVALYDR
jgi:hypothetical protein